jgi:hypothetical protein
MSFYPSLAAGLVFASVENQPAISGTCFTYGDRDTLLTAAHCVPDHADEFVVFFPPEREPRRVLEVRRAEVDLAVLFAEPAKTTGYEKQIYNRLNGDEIIVEAGDFVGYGFPVEGAADRAVGRTFKGHMMRHFRYEPPNGQPYVAVEMSIPAPGGFSGGPLCYVHEPQKPFAVVTGNIDSSATIDQFQEIQKDGVIYREKIVRVVSYGIAKMLIGSAPWLKEAVIR